MIVRAFRTPARRTNHDRQHRQQVAKVLQVIEKRIPTTQLPASPRRGPTFLAQVMDHLKHVEVARNGIVQHADEETCDRQREVSVDGKLLRDGADHHLRNSPGAPDRSEPHHHDEDSDGEKCLPHLVGGDVLQAVNALQQVEQEPVDRRQRKQRLTSEQRFRIT